jgi:hypothetical protein
MHVGPIKLFLPLPSDVRFALTRIGALVGRGNPAP